MPNEQILQNAQIIWEYMQLNQTIAPADLIIGLGSHDLRVAERASELYLQKYAPLILFTGNLGRLTASFWTEAEAQKFAQVARQMGVPDDKILSEDKSTNTGENIRFAYSLLKELNIKASSVILVHEPNMERRSYATFSKQWPDPNTKFTVTSPRMELKDKPTAEVDMQTILNILVGDLQRVIEYPKLGFQTTQEVPAKVMIAYQFLVKQGFTKNLINN